MTQISETAQWGTVYQLENGDPANGGAVTFSGDDPTTGHANAQAKRLVERTAMLRNRHPVPRNCIISGPVTTNPDQPNWASVSTLDVTVAADVAFSFSGGLSTIGPTDFYAILGSALTIDMTTPAASGDYHQLFAVYNASTGVVSLESQLVDASTNMWASTGIEPAHVSGKFWHNPLTGLTQQSDGADWTTVYAVFIGSIDTSTGTAVVVQNPYQTILVPREPIGSIRQRLSVGQLPYGWFVCNGATVKIGLYRELYDTIGTTYGSATDSFLIPSIGAQSLGNASVQTLIRLV